MKKFISVLLTLALLMTLVTGTAFADQGNGKGHSNGKEFKDIKGHWGIESIKKMESCGVLKGYDDGTFRPDNYLTQAELAVIIDRIVEKKLNNYIDEKITDDDDKDLKDVPAWAKKAVNKGFKHKYFNLKRFHSQVQTDRLMACVAIAKALELEPVTDYKFNPFKDSRLISEEDYGYLVALYEAGYIKGFPNGNFNPNSLLKRAEIAAIIEKLFEDKDEITKDETTPVWPTNSAITASNIKANSVELTWTAATDNEKVVGYKISYELNDVVKVKYVSDSKTAVITGLEAEEEYTFTVEAKDSAGNLTDDGPSVEVTTLEEEDTESPTWATGAALTVTTSSATTVTLEWDEADDNIAVTKYLVKAYEAGVLLKSSEIDVNEAEISGLKEDTEYTFKVKAQDEAGNWSSYLSKTYLTN